MDMRFFILVITFLLCFNLGYAEDKKTSDETITVTIHIQKEGPKKDLLKEQALNDAINQSLFEVLQTFSFGKDHQKLPPIVEKFAASKMFEQVTVKDEVIRKEKKHFVFEGDFEFIFSKDKIFKLLKAYNIEVKANKEQNVKLLIVPFFIEEKLIAPWFDSKVAKHFYSMPKSVADYELTLFLPEDYPSAIAAMQKNKAAAHSKVYELLKNYGASNYAMLICEQQPNSSIACSIHLVAAQKHFKNFEVAVDDSSENIVTELLTFISETHTKASAETETKESEKKASKNELQITFVYKDLPELLNFKNLLSQSPFVHRFSIVSTSLNKSVFKIEILGNREDFVKWMRENGVAIDLDKVNNNGQIEFSQ